MAKDTLTELAVDGAIAVASGVTKLTKDGEGSHTLADPSASDTSIELDIISGSDYVQTVAGRFYDGNCIYTQLQFSKGGDVRLRSDQNYWYVSSANAGVTLLGVAVLEDAEVSESNVPAVTWDPANHFSMMVLSNNNQTATQAYDGSSGQIAYAMSAPAVNGVVAYKVNCTYPEGSGWESLLALALAGLPFDATIPSAGPLYDKECQLDGYSIGLGQDLGIPVLSGGNGYVYVDGRNGFMWHDNDNDVYLADREAGTNPHWTFQPLQGPWALVGELFTTDTVVFTLDPTYSSGRFGSLNDYVPDTGSTWVRGGSNFAQISPDGLTISTNTGGGCNGVSTITRSDGLRVISLTPTFSGAPEDGEAYIGIIDLGGGFSARLAADGSMLVTGIGITPTAKTFTSGQEVLLHVKQSTGEGWFFEVAGDPDFVFTPGTALLAYVQLYSADDASPVSVLMNPNRTSGASAAWDS